MLGGIAAVAFPAPGVVLLPAGALAAQHVRIRPPLTRVLDRLVHVERDLVARRRLDDLAPVPDHVLAVVGVALGREVADVAGLDRSDAQPVVERERVLQLALVVLDAHRRLVVTDELNAAFAGVSGHGFQVEVRVGLGEREELRVC